MTVKPGEDGTHTTFCRLCEALCGLTVEVKGGEIVKIGPDRENPHSRGHLCLKGPAMAEIQRDPDRVLTPLKRAGGPGDFVAVSWEAALDEISERLAAVLKTVGPDAVATYTGNPAAYSTGLLYGQREVFRALGFRKHFNPGSQDTTARVVANYCLYGSLEAGGIPDLDRCDLLLMFGANPLVSHGSNLITPRIREDLDALAKRGEVVVFDPRRTETAERYTHVQLNPTSDVWVLGALVSELFRIGGVDADFLARHTEGAEELAAAVAGLTPELAEARSGVPADTIRSLAARFATGASAAYGRVGLCRGPYSTLANVLLDALNIAAGRFAKPGGWVFGYSPIGAPPASGPRGYSPTRSRVADLPTVGGVMPSLVMAGEILEPGADRVRALFVMAGNPVLSTPGGALEALDLFVAADLYLNETNRHADFILPAATFLERPDVITLPLSNMLRPYMQHTDAVLPPRGEARHELHIYQAIAERVLRRLGRDVPAWADPFDLFDAGLHGGDSGLTLQRLKEEPHGLMLDRPLLFEGWQARLGYPDGRIRLWHPLIAGEFARLASEPSATATTLRLFGRRELKWMNSWMHNVDRLVRQGPPPLEMHPLDAAARSLADGAWVKICATGGAAIAARLHVTDAVARGSVCYPHGWGHQGGWQTANAAGGGNVNALAPSRPEDAEGVSGSSFLDGIPVTVAAADEPGAARAAQVGGTLA
jgi:anaerobic selenocysteine-containing dehydrogenase